MADKVEVEIGGQSKYEVAHRIAMNIFTLEKKKFDSVKREEYLRAVSEAIVALQGGYA